MMGPYRWMLTISLLAASVALTSGCTRGEAPGAVPGQPVNTQIPAPPGAGEPATTPETQAERKYREAVRNAAVNNPKVAALIPRKPTMGGSWRVGSKEDVHFLGNGQVALDYEDGHVAGRLVVKVDDPHDPATWQVIRDEPQ
jgi:hypothetical protein